MSPARPAIAALAVLAATDMLRTLLAVGRYEDRITTVTHGAPDLYPAAFAYALADHLLDLAAVRLPVHQAADLLWTLALLVTAATVAGWLLAARRRPSLDRATVGWLAAAVTLRLAATGYDVLTIGPGRLVDGPLTSRLVAYPLWTAATAALVIAAVRLARALRAAAPGPSLPGRI